MDPVPQDPPPPSANAGAPQSPDPAHPEMDSARKRWLAVAGFVGWVAALIGTAMSFDVALAPEGGAGTDYKAFLLIIATVLFLLAGRAIDRIPAWALAILLVASVGCYFTYDQLKAQWTCAYYPASNPNRLVIGTRLLPERIRFLAANPQPDGKCETLMENWGGNSLEIWESDGVMRRFITLFGLYAFTWLNLAFLIFGVARLSLRRRPAP